MRRGEILSRRNSYFIIAINFNQSPHGNHVSETPLFSCFFARQYAAVRHPHLGRRRLEKRRRSGDRRPFRGEECPLLVKGVALITGSAGIIGPGICASLKADGWIVAASDRTAGDFERHAERTGASVEADAIVPANLEIADAAPALIAEVQRRLGPVTLLVNNATAHNQGFTLAELDPVACERIWKVDVLAPLLLTRAATADLAAARGLVVNISSVRAHHITIGHLPYIAAKAAIEKMTEAMALELAEKRIRVNCLRLGAVPGDAFLRPALDLLPPDLASQLRQDVLPTHITAVGAASSLTEAIGTPRDIGQTIAFLASPAGSFINSAVIPVDGGFTLKQHLSTSEGAQPSTEAQQWTADPRGKLREWLKARGILP